MKKILSLLSALTFVLGFTACGGDDDDNGETPVVESISLTASSIAEGAEIDATVTSITLTYSAAVKATGSPAVTLNGNTVQVGRGSSLKELTVDVALEAGTSYTLSVPTGAVVSTTDANNMAKPVTLKFTTKKPAAEDDTTAPAGMTSTANGLVKKIVVGWNLGNTCEAGIWDGWNDDDLNIETNWLNPKVKTSKAMFTALKNAGFNAIRVPVRWYVHADDNMTINDRWMARVKEIVDYAVSQDMYVILNSHHDNWYDRLPVGYSETDIHAKYEKMWTQIATYFKDYDEHLIFAGSNEIIKLKSDGAEDWGSPNSSNIKFANDLMQLFVNTVRATGGNNAWRCLMVQPWACSPSNALNSGFAMPTDTKENRLILEYHCYDPYNYCTLKTQHEVSQSDYDNISKLFANLNSKFVSKDIPCIMAEFGSTQDNSDDKKEATFDKVRADYLTFVVKEAKKYGIPGFYWDNYCFKTSGENFGLLDRQNCNFPARAKIALDGIMAGLK